MAETLTTLTGTLRELSVQYATKQPNQVDYLTEETPVLDSVPFEPSSHALWNVYDEVTEVSGGGFVDMDAPLPELAVSSQLRKIDLSIIGGRMFCPEDKARAFGGKDTYFARKTPKALRKLGVDAEVSVIYDNLRAYALDQGKALDAGGTGSANHCILAVRWVPGETMGLYSPEGFGQGALINTASIMDGALYENGEGVLGYGVRLKGYFGVQLANPDTVAGIFNVDIAEGDTPTALMVDNLLDMVRGGENTFLYCHRKVMSVLADAGKGAAFQMSAKERDVDRRIAEWNGVPIVTSYNFKDASEAMVDVG